jgi:hypothetical protein
LWTTETVLRVEAELPSAALSFQRFASALTASVNLQANIRVSRSLYSAGGDTVAHLLSCSKLPLHTPLSRFIEYDQALTYYSSPYRACSSDLPTICRTGQQKQQQSVFALSVHHADFGLYSQDGFGCPQPF